MTVIIVDFGTIDACPSEMQERAASFPPYGLRRYGLAGEAAPCYTFPQGKERAWGHKRTARLHKRAQALADSLRTGAPGPVQLTIYTLSTEEDADSILEGWRQKERQQWHKTSTE